MTREQLEQYRHIKRERDLLQEMVHELEITLADPKAPKLDQAPPKSAQGKSKTEAREIKREEVFELYQGKIAALTAALVEIEQALEILQPRERTLLRLHYIQGLTLEQVCVIMRYSWRHIRRIHKRALQQLEGTEE